MSVPQSTESPHQSQRPPVPPFPEDPFTATRHLCAGAYLDDTFRNDTLREVYYQPRRVVAPSYGFDVIPVLAHCLRARNGAILRDGLIIGTLVISACIKWEAIVVVLAFMAVLQSTVATYRLAREAVGKLRNAEPVALGALAVRVFLLIVGWSLALTIGSIGLTALFGAATSSFGGGGFDDATTTVVTTVYGSILLGLLVFCYPVAFTLWRQTELAKMAPGVRVTQPIRNQRLDDIGKQQRGNTTVYSGFKPYVGSGAVVDSWGFAQRLVRAEDRVVRDGSRAGYLPPAPTERQREFAHPPFGAEDLIRYVRANLSNLTPHPGEAEEQISGLTVEDRVCLAGTEVTQLAPYTDPQTMAAVIRFPTTPARHYLACQVFAWGGELITTVYVHIAVQGRSLYLELTTTALPPSDRRFRIVDLVDGHGSVAWFRAFRDGLVDTPRTIWRSPLNLVAALINMAVGATDSPVQVRRGFDYGARVGVRELGAQPGMRYLIQTQDVVKYKRLIERRVIASVLDYLDECGVDTAEYRARAASVLNMYGDISGGVNNLGRATYNGNVSAAGGKA